MKVGSLCTGYGGIELGLKMAGEDIDLRWYAEIEPDLIGPLRDVWHPGAPNHGDITTINWSQVEHVDLIVGGIPCQPTSAAGRRLGDADPRWLWPYARTALEVLRPARFLLENVRGLVSFDKGRLFDGILNDLITLGYGARWLTLGACAVGLAHHRHRVFLLAERSESPSIERLNIDECGARRGRSIAALVTLLPTPVSTLGRSTGFPSIETAARRIADGKRYLDDAIALLPAPTARDGDGRGAGTAAYWSGARGKRTEGRPLDAVIALLPTPTATDARGSRNATANRAPGSMANPGETLTDAFWLLPTPRATDGTNGGPNQAGRRWGVPDLRAVQPERWGRFATAIVRHAEICGDPPEPTEPNRNGAPRLRPQFVEWLMCVPAGHVTEHLDRRSALKALGNGVSPPQLAAGWRMLVDDKPTANYARHDTSITTGVDQGVYHGQASATPTERSGADRDRGTQPVPAPAGADRSDGGGTGKPRAERIYADSARDPRSASGDAGIPAHRGRSEVLMATSEDMRREMERLDSLRRDVIRLAQDATGDLGPYESGHYERMARALHAAMIGLAGAWRAEAIKLEDSTKRGAKGMRERLRASAEDLGGFAGRLTSPEFVRSLAQTDEVSPPSTPAPAPPSALVAETATEIASIVNPVIAYLKGETDTLPAVPAEQLTIDELNTTPAPAPVADSTMEVAPPMTFPPLAFVAPSAAAPDRLSWDAFARLIAELDVPTQGSFTMISALAECGMAYALGRLAKRDKVPHTLPAWWEAGGTTFHRTTEVIEKIILRDGQLPTDFDPAALWLAHFNGVIHELEQSSGADQSRWRVNRAGENFDWWRVHGPEMVRRYMAYHSPEYRQTNRILVMPGGQPAIELELTLDLAGWPFKVIIDQVWDQYRINQHGIWESTIFIRDMKSGATKPASTFQLGGYAHALADALGSSLTAEHTIAGGFYDARAGSHDMEVSDLIAKHPLTELRYRAHAARQQAQARAYLPRVSNFAGGCGSCVHKTVCPAQG